MGASLGSAQYVEGLFKPLRGREHNWLVRCAAGALEVIRSAEYRQWLVDHPNGSYSIYFCGNTAANICPGDELWVALQEVAASFAVGVFKPAFEAKYVPWTGADKDPGCFDCIKISLLPALPPEREVIIIIATQPGGLFFGG